MKLSKSEKEAFNIISLGIVEYPNTHGIKYEVLCSLVKKGLVEWCNDRGIHGRYTLTDKGRTILEEIRNGHN